MEFVAFNIAIQSIFSAGAERFLFILRLDRDGRVGHGDDGVAAFRVKA